MIDGLTRVIAHVGHPTTTFRSSLIYNPFFERIGFNAAVVPMGVTADDFISAFPQIMRFSNVIGALVTMPHKISVMELLDEVLPTARAAGSCNAVKRLPDGRLVGDMFDGEGFVRGLARKGRTVAGASALVAGAGGVGSAIAASLCAAGLRRIVLSDPGVAAMQALAGRLAAGFPHVRIETGHADPAGCEIVVNATPLGMNEDDPLPLDIDRIEPGAIVGEVVLSREITPLLAAALQRGLAVQTGLDMLYEQIPVYLAFFGLPNATPDELRRYSRAG